MKTILKTNKKAILEIGGIIEIRTTMTNKGIYTGYYFLSSNGYTEKLNPKTFSSLTKNLEKISLKINGVEVDKDIIPTLQDGTSTIVSYNIIN